VANSVELTVNAFFGDELVELQFPDDWEVIECRMAGHAAPVLSDEEMRRALRSPYGSPPLSELARGAKDVCILFDDLPKPTPAHRIAPLVIENLHEAGIRDDQIRFVCALGSHRPLAYPEFVAKLGREIVETYPVYNHSVWENLVYVGRTSRGTPVHVNREVASCDLRVGLGGLLPHGLAGFGGGAKLVLPGVAGIETIDHSHRQVLGNTGLARVDDNEFRLNLEEGTRMVGLHFKVDTVLNNRREIIGLFAGDFVAAHRAAAGMARLAYSTETVRDADIVVVNSYPDESQVGRSFWPIDASLRPGGDAVLICYSWEGQNMVQAASRFGSAFGGRLWEHNLPSRFRKLAKAERVFLLAEHLSRYDREDIAPPDKLVWQRDWRNILAELVGTHGRKAKVAVYPYAALQIPAA
jgi:lactate racemase